VNHDSLMRSGKRLKVAIQTIAAIEKVESGAREKNKIREST